MNPRLRNGILAVVCGLAVASTAGASYLRLVVKPSRTRVGIVRVVLSIQELAQTETGLRGDYAIRVPLAPFMDDSGTIEIPLAGDLAEAVSPGRVLRGTASSREDGRVHEVACTFRTEDQVHIVVKTPDRVLSFEAPYSLSR